ncbi:MAG: MBL fold metallo-hydrolase [Desulfarculus sp.]|nr:MBL fold metallo-hydrolase [Desulfarculus sp.]
MPNRPRPLACLTLLLPLLLLWACAAQPTPQEAQPPQLSAAPLALESRCAQPVGPPRVERISQHVWAAIGHDTANTVVISTPEGLVVVDAGMTPARARQALAALKQVVPWGPVKALVFTHSHMDHIGGATAWAPEGTPIWATDQTAAHLLKQYGRFKRAEITRGGRQLGQHVPLDLLPCSALGRRADLDLKGELGFLLPDHTFSGSHTLKVGGVEIVLKEAPGETHDHLFVWLPGEGTLIAGDDFYWTFPNLYTIRGASPRPVDQWIKSLDAMRACAPEHLIPCHTKPIHGAGEIAQALTDYRDAIQWVRDQVVRRANQGQDLDTIAREVKLPAHLAGKPYLQETYGQVDWSAKAIYINNLGWFDGRPERLYPLDSRQAAGREVELLGGAGRVLDLAGQALAQDDPRWAAHLLAKLKDAGLATGALAGPWRQAQIQALEATARQTANTNGRAYLLESAHELAHGLEPLPGRPLPPRMARQIPVDFLLEQMAANLDPTANLEVHQSLVLELPDLGRRYVITQRRGVGEAVAGAARRGTPPPLATLSMDSGDFRDMALGLRGPLALHAEGRIKVEGGWLKALAFLARFRPAGAGGA